MFWSNCIRCVFPDFSFRILNKLDFFCLQKIRSSVFARMLCLQKSRKQSRQVCRNSEDLRHCGWSMLDRSSLGKYVIRLFRQNESENQFIPICFWTRHAVLGSEWWKTVLCQQTMCNEIVMRRIDWQPDPAMRPHLVQWLGMRGMLQRRSLQLLRDRKFVQNLMFCANHFLHLLSKHFSFSCSFFARQLDANVIHLSFSLFILATIANVYVRSLLLWLKWHI